MIDRIFQSTGADCLNACVASLTGIPLEELNLKCPHRTDLEILGLLLVEVAVENGKLNLGISQKKASKPFELILGIKNEDGSFHAVVGEIVLGEHLKLSVFVTHDPDISATKGKVYTITSLTFLSRRL